MKCPKCGASNPDGAESCQGCGVRFRRMITVKTHVVLKDSKQMKRRSMNRLVLIPLGVSLSVAVGALLVAILLFSPWLSPLASVHDSDGDSYPDAYDFDPSDSELWSEGESLVVVMIHSSHPYTSYNYTLLVNGEACAHGELAAGETKVENIEVSYAIGEISHSQIVLGMTATDGSAEQRDLVLENGMGYQANFTIPFSLG
ncbi:MAG: hypothetical protein LUQ16_04390 [Methanomassiliicoccales archaeon]|nr:hypothetical protein [Methanomassiliicoccales archaeon]